MYHLLNGMRWRETNNQTSFCSHFFRKSSHGSCDASTMAEKDDFVNSWGCDLVTEPLRSSTRGLSSDATVSSFEALVASSTKGIFKFHSLHGSGSVANQVAIDLATRGDVSACLVAMGSYVAGNGSSIQQLSSSTYTAKQSLSIVASPFDENMSDSCKQQTIALPYHIPHPLLSKSAIQSLERRCLIELERAILIGMLSGKVYRAFLFEPVLSGCGGELSMSFLKSLGTIFLKYNIIVIVDEIMTGGRTGPGMLMTPGFPHEFISCVKYVTMGKIFGAGIVLSKISKRPQSVGHFRGTSTTISPCSAYLKWKAIQERINNGVIASRRSVVLKLYGLDGSPNSHWGKGCLIFMEYARHQVQMGLKCRLLPKLEDIKCEKLQVTKTIYNRERVCSLLMDSANAWIDSRRVLYEESKSPFVVALVDFMLSREFSATIDSRGYFEINPPVFLEFAGNDSVRKMEQQKRALKRAKNHCYQKTSYEKKEIRIIHSALDEICKEAAGHCFRSCRIGSRTKRLAGYRFFPVSLSGDDG